MPFCPQCRAEYRPGFTHCVDCEVYLVDTLSSDEGDDAGDGPSWVKLTEVTAEVEAQLIQGYLESIGIECAIENLKFHAEPVNFGPLSRIRLHVLDSELQAAREALEKLPEISDLPETVEGPDTGAGEG